MTKYIILFYVVIFLFLAISGFNLFMNKKFIRRRKITEIRKKILEKKEPGSPEEAKFYEQIMERYKSRRPLYAWGNFLLLQYYKDNYNENKEKLSMGIACGEKIRNEFKEYSFYENALFILGNIYFFETFNFNMASDVYKQLIKERKNTRWESICQDRIKLMSDSFFDAEALKLYVFAERYFENSRFEDAEFYLKEVIKRYPKTSVAASASYFLGDINYYKYNDLDSALKYYKITSEKFPHCPMEQTLLYKAGEILRKMNRWEEAIGIYRDYIKKFKSSPFKDDAYFYVGECYQNLGKLREAKNSFNLVLGDYPNSKWTDVIYHRVQDINKILKEL